MKRKRSKSVLFPDWFPFADRDFFEAVDKYKLTDTQTVAYLKILAAMYHGDGWLDGASEVRKASGLRNDTFTAFVPRLKDILIRRGQRYSHPRVLEEFKKIKEIKNERSKAGKAGADKRWNSQIANANCTDGKQIAIHNSHSTKEFKNSGAPVSPLRSTDIERAREAFPGYDIDELERRWLEWTGPRMETLRHPDRAFFAFCERHIRSNPL